MAQAAAQTATLDVAPDQIEATLNYIVDTGIPPVHYIDWPKMAEKAIPAQYELHEVTIHDGRPQRLFGPPIGRRTVMRQEGEQAAAVTPQELAQTHQRTQSRPPPGQALQQGVAMKPHPRWQGQPQPRYVFQPVALGQRLLQVAFEPCQCVH